MNQSKRGGSIALSTLIIVGAVGTLIAGRMADKFGNRKVIMAGSLKLTIPKVDLNGDSVNKAKFNVTKSSN